MKKYISLFLVILLLSAVVYAFATPGTETDPLVTLKYVEKRLTEVKEDILSQVKSGDNQKGNTTTKEHPVFEIYQYVAGTKLTFGASTEFIVRRGKALVIDPLDNNIPDLTTGIDIKKGEVVPLNHQLLCPRDDGRGIEVVEDIWIMIKGPFKVVQ